MRVLAASSTLPSARGETPQPIMVDAEGRETEMSAALDDLLLAVAVVACVLAEESMDDRELSTMRAARRLRVSR